MVTIKPVGFFFDTTSGAAPVAPEGTIPSAEDFGSVWVENAQAATNFDAATADAYDGGGATRCSVHLTDNATDFAYLTFQCAHGLVDAHNTNTAILQQRHNTGASDGTTPSVASASTGTEMRQMDVGGSDANHHWIQSRCSVSSAGIASEWGLWFVESGDVGTYTVDGACLVVLPAQNTPLNTGASYQGTSYLIAANTFRIATGTLDPVGITAADTDNTSTTADMVIANAGDYLIFCTIRMEGVNFADNSGVTSIRWTVTDDGTDIFGVKTNTATSGAVRTGRGFQHNIHMLNAANKVRTGFSPFVVRNLDAATHTFALVGNKHDNATDGTDRILNDGVVAIKTSQFAQFEYLEDTTALTLDSDTYADWNAGVTVIGDGSTEFWIGFSTTLHAETAGSGMDFQFTANGTRIDTVAHGRDNPYGNGDGQAGVADSDNCTLPVSYWIVHTPAAENTTYKLQVRRSTANTIMNCNDNGASGYKGTLFAASMSFTVGD